MWRTLLRLLGLTKPATDNAPSSRSEGAPATSPEPSDTATAQASSVAARPSNEGATSRTSEEARARRGPGSSFIDLVIGLDLGTSSTKVAVRAPYAFNQRVVAAALRPHSQGIDRYLLPTRLAVGNEGVLVLDTFVEIGRAHV